jgi:hypothetical protein
MLHTVAFQLVYSWAFRVELQLSQLAVAARVAAVQEIGC